MEPLACGRQKKPQRRIGYLNIADIASHHWFAGFDWKAFHELELPPPFKPKVKDDGDLSNFDKYEEISHSTFPKCSWSPEGFEAAK